MRRFWDDDWARIPFSIIGVFLCLGSSVTTVYIAQLEQEKSKEIASTLSVSDVDIILRYAESDICTAVNFAGIKALQVVGKKPVIIPDSFGGYGETSDEINENRIREIIQGELNIYLSGNYLYDRFTDGRFIVNVLLPDGMNAVPDMSVIQFQTAMMHLCRSFGMPVLGPSQEVDHPVYWMISVPIQLEVSTCDDPDTVIFQESYTAESVVTSRYLLLKALVDEYKDTISDSFCPYWMYTTIFSNLYSVIRGLQHQRTGKPLNVVDNKHLALIANSGLVLEQGFVFSGVDPMSLVDLASETVSVLRGTTKTSIDSFNEDMAGSEYDYDPNNVTEGSASVDSGGELGDPVDSCPYLNLSDVAERVLYDIVRVHLFFRNPTTGDLQEEIVDYGGGDITEKIHQKIVYWSERSYVWERTEKDLSINATTDAAVRLIIDSIYHASLSTKVTERLVLSITDGTHEGYPDDGGSSSWSYTGFTSGSKTEIKPDKGHVVLGCSLYSEQYTTNWVRDHTWCKTVVELHNISGNLTEVPVTYCITVTDTKTEQVTLQVILDHYAQYSIWDDSVVDALYLNTSIHPPQGDPNLEDTLEAYISEYPDSDAVKRTMIQNGGVGTIGLVYSPQGDQPDWVYTDAWSALQAILYFIGTIQQDPMITPENYPNPVDLISMVKDDLLQKFQDNKTLYENWFGYWNGANYLSVGMKAIYFIRCWYVEKVEQEIIHDFSQVETKVQQVIDEHVPEEMRENVQSTLQSDAVSMLKDHFAIPFSLDINMTSLDLDYRLEDPAWTETIRVAVDQFPNYLSPFVQTEYEGVQYWSMGIKNICTLGSTGVPILPQTPVTPWVCTLNIWMIEVKGEYAEFRVMDCSDETSFNPIFGHDPQIYLRKYDQIWNPDETIFLGDNSRLTFSQSTVAFGIVPPWGMMVGDIEGGYEEKHGSYTN